MHDAIGVIDHVRCREEHTAAPHKTCVLADREGNEQWQVVYQGCIAEHPCSRVGDVKGVPCIVCDKISHEQLKQVDDDDYSTQNWIK